MSLTISLSGLLSFITGPLFYTLVGLPLVLILLDVLTGVGASLRHGVFSARQLSNFLSGDLEKYVVAAIIVGATWFVSGSSGAQATAALLSMPVLAVSVIASIKQNCADLFGPLAPMIEADAVAFANQVTHRSLPEVSVPPPSLSTVAFPGPPVPPPTSLPSALASSATSTVPMMNTLPPGSVTFQVPAAPPIVPLQVPPQG